MTMRSNVIIILLLWGLTGCSDFLEEKSQSEIRPSTVRDMEKILEGEAYFTAEEGYVLNRGTDIFSDNIGWLWQVTRWLTIGQERSIISERRL